MLNQLRDPSIYERDGITEKGLVYYATMIARDIILKLMEDVPEDMIMVRSSRVLGGYYLSLDLIKVNWEDTSGEDEWVCSALTDAMADAVREEIRRFRDDYRGS